MAVQGAPRRGMKQVMEDSRMSMTNMPFDGMRKKCLRDLRAEN